MVEEKEVRPIEESFGEEVSQVKPKLKLVGVNGNAFAILGKAQKAAKKAGWTEEERKQMLDEAMSGDYDHLLQVMMKYFDVS